MTAYTFAYRMIMSLLSLPHPQIVLSQIRINDVWLLLFIGGAYEFLCRSYILFAIKLKSTALLQKEHSLQQLTSKTNQLRKLGPSSFVETSKLERQVLALEKELNTIYEQRKRTNDIVEKQLLRYGNMQIAIVIFFLYYGVPILSIQTNMDRLVVDEAATMYLDASTYLKRILFPISYIGTGIKLSRWGIPGGADAAASSFGALAIMWASQVTVGQIMDAVEAYYLQ